MGAHVRIRCPICGMLVWQKRLDKDYPFEFVIQHIDNVKGLKGLRHSYQKSREAQTKAGSLFKLFFADKMVRKAQELVQDLPFDVVINMEIPDYDEVAKDFDGWADDREKVKVPLVEQDEVAEEDSFERWRKKGLLTIADIKDWEIGIEIPTLNFRDVGGSVFNALKGTLGIFHRVKRDKKSLVDLREFEMDVDDIELSSEV